MEEGYALLAAGAAALGLALTPAQEAAFTSYHALLLEWNRRFNLVGPGAVTSLWSRHFLDALTVVCAVPAALREYPLACLDVGSGAGMPGLPLQIAFPHWKVTLLEVTAKKVRFLETAVRGLGLAECSVAAGRAEDLAHDRRYREAFDLCLARAVSRTAALLEVTLPFVALGGAAILYKTASTLSDELDAAEAARTILGAAAPDVLSISLPDYDSRLLVRYEKVARTPEGLPRAAGVPEHHSLLEAMAGSPQAPRQVQGTRRTRPRGD